MPSRLAKTRPLSAVPPDPAPGATPEVTRNEPAACDYCFGAGMEVVAGCGARRCRCRAEERRQGLLEAARIPRRFERCTLTNYRPDPGQPT
jgi:DNA replication protein DnaC